MSNKVLINTLHGGAIFVLGKFRIFYWFMGQSQELLDPCFSCLNSFLGISHAESKYGNENLNFDFFSLEKVKTFLHELHPLLISWESSRSTVIKKVIELISDKVFTDSCILSYQIRQSAVTNDMTIRALGGLSDGLKQALEEAKTTQTEQLEQFMKNQTEELKITVQDSVAKGTQEVLKKLQPQLDVIRKDISTLSQRTKDVSNAAFILAYCSSICRCDHWYFA